MAANDAANVDPSRRTSEALSGSLVREMAAAADQCAEIETPNEVTARAIAHCAELLSRFWPADASGDSASGGSQRNCEASAISDSVLSGEGSEYDAGANRIGRFEIRRGLGHGGFGVVFLVFDPRLNREAALKIPRPEIMVSSTLRQRFLREAQAAAVLDHPNIVPIYETGEVGPVGYILSGYCKGPTLASWLRDQPGPVTPKVATEIVAKLADAVHHAHSRGILHRDIKPANVLLEPAADTHPGGLTFIPRLSDFGLAKRLDETSGDTQAGMILGTPRYMAPEQAAGDYRDIGIQTDVYSLGVILYELLAGQPPFVGRTDSETLHKIQSDGLSPAMLRARHVPRDLETICLKCLEKEQPARYQSAHELADDLRRFLAGDPVSARPIRASERLARWCRKRPVVATLAGCLVLAISIGAGIATWQWMRAEQHLVDAVAEASRAEKNLGQAEDTLLDLAWLVEESTLWDTRNKSVLGAIHEKLDEYHRSVATQRDADAVPAPLMAAVYSFAARNAAASANTSSADENYRRSLELWREIVSRHADHPGYRRALSLCLLNYCRFLLDTKQTPDDEDRVELSRTYLRTIAEDEHWRHWSLFDFVQLTLEYADALDGATRFRDSLGVYQLGLIASEELLRRDPRDPRWHYFIGQFCRLVGVHQERLRAGEVALGSFTRARESLERAVEAVPDNWRYRYELATTLRALGSLHRQQTPPTDALPPLESAIALYANLCTERPDDPAMQADLAITHRLVAGTQLALMQQDKALESFLNCRLAWRQAKDLDPGMSDQNLKLMAHACYAEGELAMTLSRHEAARVALIEGIATFEAASQRGRMNTTDDLDWAGCHVFLGFQQAAAEQTEAAIKSYQAAIGILEPRVGRANADKRVQDLHRRCIKRVTELQREPSAAGGDAQDGHRQVGNQ